ncbi:MAG: hypothetical protein EZS28_028008, partial [Streblomastix strix]
MEDILLTDFLEASQIEQIRAFFQDCGGSQEELDEIQLQQCFQEVIQFRHPGDAYVSDVFRKIDSDCTGRISWSEFSSFFLQQSAVVSTTSDSMEDPLYHGIDELIIDTHQRESIEYHKQPISSVIYVPLMKQYLSSSADGQLKVWDGSLNGQQTMTYDHSKMTKHLLQIEHKDVLAPVKTKEVEMVEQQL